MGWELEDHFPGADSGWVRDGFGMRPEDANSSALAFRALAPLTTLQRDLVAWQAEDTQRSPTALGLVILN